MLRKNDTVPTSAKMVAQWRKDPEKIMEAWKTLESSSPAWRRQIASRRNAKGQRARCGGQTGTFPFCCTEDAQGFLDKRLRNARVHKLHAKGVRHRLIGDLSPMHVERISQRLGTDDALIDSLFGNLHHPRERHVT
jgi:hypothetical protein